jgi:hypothetical protein
MLQAVIAVQHKFLKRRQHQPQQPKVDSNVKLGSMFGQVAPDVVVVLVVVLEQDICGVSCYQADEADDPPPVSCQQGSHIPHHSNLQACITATNVGQTGSS